MSYPSRHSNRLSGYDYAREGAYYITLCTHRRQHLFGEGVDADVQLTPLGQIVAATWYEIPMHFPHVTLDAFIVMPNHIHGIIALGRPAILVGAQFIAPTPHMGTTRDRIRTTGGKTDVNQTGGTVREWDRTVEMGGTVDRTGAMVRTGIVNEVGATINEVGGETNINGADAAAREMDAAMDRTGDTVDVMDTAGHMVGAMNCAPTETTTTLGSVVRAFKARVTATANHARGDLGMRVWQRNYNDRIIRSAAELNRIRQYITDNPRNWQQDPEG